MSPIGSGHPEILRRAAAYAPPAVHRVRAHRRRRQLGLGDDSRIFGIGLSRTGTTSLNVALEMLSIKSMHLPVDEASMNDLFRFVQLRPRSMRMSILDTYDALTDTPACVMLEALDRAYPGSRFILTTREKESWLDSCARHWATVLAPFAEPRRDPISRYFQELSRALYGSAEFHRARFAEAYDRYHERVDRHFSRRPDDLLRLSILEGESWGPVCEFLDRPQPEAEFPLANAAAVSG